MSLHHSCWEMPSHAKTRWTSVPFQKLLAPCLGTPQGLFFDQKG